MAETISTNQFKNGMHVEVDGLAWRIVEFQHVKPGKGGAFVRTKLKAVDSGKVVERTFRAGETMPRVQTSTEDVQYLYDDGTNYVFMRTKNYEQIPLSHEAVAAEVAYLKEGDTVLAALDGRRAVVAAAARLGELTVSRDRAGREGRHGLERDEGRDARDRCDRAGPLFVNEGDKVKVDTRDGRYLSRA